MFIEYTLLYRLIGHPNFLLLGIIAAFSPLIPYFGGIIMNIVAIITASVISTKLLILCLIICLIFPQIDGYLISPKIYGKTNKVPALVTIFAVFAGGVLGGFVGIIIALPIAIILQTIYKYYDEEISEKISNLKEKI
jgi:predicted PurR-regulated permease PerM